MNTRKRPRRWMVELLLAVPAALPASAAPERATIDCGPAQDLASHAYTELRNAILQRDFSGACRLRNVFWQIEKYGGACPNVSKMATLLAEKNLGRNDSCPRLTTYAPNGGSFGSSGSAGSDTASSNNTGAGLVTGSSGTSGSSGSASSSGSSGSTSTGGSDTGADSSGAAVGR